MNGLINMRSRITYGDVINSAVSYPKLKYFDNLVYLEIYKITNSDTLICSDTLRVRVRTFFNIRSFGILDWMMEYE